MAVATLTDAFSILANEETFIDKDLLYVAGGLLVVLALVFSFLGMRNKDFPSSSQLKVIVGVFAVLVLVTGFGALQTARFEQAERRLESQEAAKEASEQDVQNEQSLGQSGAGEAADPESGTGATPDTPAEDQPAGEPQSGAGGAGGASADVEAGRTLFTDTGCGGCHTLADAGSSGQTGPDLDESVAQMDAEEVRTAIIDPGADVAAGFPDGTMPTTYGDQLDETQIDTLVNYLVGVTQKG